MSPARLAAQLSARLRRRRLSRASDRVKHLSEEQIESLFAAIARAGSARDLAMFRVAYHRGLRASEIGLLQRSDYDSGRNRLYVRRKKGSDSGSYPLVDAERKALQAWLRVRGHEEGPLFPSRRNGPISQQQLDVLIKRYGAAAGVPRELCHMHALKHSCGTHLAAMGRELLEIKDHLGHRQIQNTMIYLRSLVSGYRSGSG